MDHISMNIFGSNSFDQIGSMPPSSRQALRESKPPVNRPTALPQRVVLYPPEMLISSSSKDQRKPVNIFKKLVAKSETSFPGKSHGKLNGQPFKPDEKKKEKKDVSWEEEWRVDPPPFVIPCTNPVFSRAGLDLCALPSLTAEQLRSTITSSRTDLGGSTYMPDIASINDLSLNFEHALAIDAPSSSKPSTVARDIKRSLQETSFACFSYGSPRALPIPSRASLMPQPMILSPPPRKAQAPRRKPPGGPNHSSRKPASSSRRTSRSRMLPTPLTKQSADICHKRFSTTSESSMVQFSAIRESPTSDYKRSFRHVQELRRQSTKRRSRGSTKRLVLPPIDLLPLTLSPLLSEFGDRVSSSGSSTPSIKTPESTVTTFSSSMVQSTIQAQKYLRRYGRVPGTFFTLDPIMPVTPFWPNTCQAVEKHDTPPDLNLTPAGPAQTSAVPPGEERSSQLAGTETSTSIRGKDNKVADVDLGRPPLLRPKLTLQVPQISVTYRSAVNRSMAGDTGANLRKIRPLPPIPIIK